MTHVEKSIERIRSLLASKAISKNRLAGLANLQESNLRNVDHEEWNPTASTLHRIERAIDSLVEGKV